VRVDGGLGNDLARVAASARASEAAGYDGVWTAEASHDPFFPLLQAVDHTSRLELGTAIAVAFARSPMTTAMAAWDLQGFSHGRFNLGLGSQIKAHIERRFSMPWSHPAPRMREFIGAMRAIWDSWQNGTKLDFRGDFYQHTLMTPFFNPGPIDQAPPAVFVAAVGEKMTEVAGEVADGMLVHPFTTERYLREVTLPCIEGGVARSGRSRSDFQLSYPAFVVTGSTEEAMATAATAARRQIAFYGSTPAYRPVLDLHGWGDLSSSLNALSKQGKWAEMGELIDDGMLASFAVVGDPASAAAQLVSRFEGVIDRISFYLPYALAEADVAALLAGVKAGARH
jgi:probable F420-dependent oxidoreductase